MTCRPCLTGAPCVGTAAHGAAALPGTNFADAMDGLSGCSERSRNVGNVSLRNRQNHADPAVEGARHLAGLYVTLRLKEGHEARLLPGIGADVRAQALGEYARNVFQQTAAGDVRQCMNFASANQWQQALHVDAGGLDQGIDQQDFRIEQGRAIQLPALVCREPAYERIPVRVDARRCESQQDIAVCHLVPRKLLAALDGADAEACKVIVSRGIHAGHFRRFAADQGATGDTAAVRDSGHDSLCDAVFQLTGGEIIEEEQGLSALNDEVVHAHGDKVDTDCVVAIMIDGKFDLGTDAIVGSNEQRVVVASGAWIEKPSESAKFRVCAGASGRLCQRRDSLHEGVAGGDGHASLFVAVALGRAVFGAIVGHGAAPNALRLGFPSGFGQKAPVSTMTTTFSQVLQRPFARVWQSGPARKSALALGVALSTALVFAGGSRLVAQIEGDRGIAPLANSEDIQVNGIEVDVTGKTGEEARIEGWKLAEKKAWEKIQGPAMPVEQIDAMVSSVVIEREQVGPHRYIARLGVIFDKAKAGRFVGAGASGGEQVRSAPLLLVPVLNSGGVQQVFEVRGPWQKAWAEFQTSQSPIDYVRPTGSGGESLILTAGQTGRRSRNWWRNILNQFEAADVLIPVARLERQWPGGPVKGTFTARYGPDDTYLDSFTLTAPNEEAVPQMLEQAVARIDGIYREALYDGALRPDPTLQADRIVVDQAFDELRRRLMPKGGAPAAPVQQTAVTPSVGPTPLATQAVSVVNLQFVTPDAASLDSTLSAVRAIGGVQSVATTSLAIGGTSVMRVTIAGGSDALAAGLRGQGWQVTGSGGILRISR